MASVASGSLPLDKTTVSSMVVESLQEAIPEAPEEGASLTTGSLPTYAVREGYICLAWQSMLVLIAAS